MKVLLINHFPLEGSGSGTYTKNIALHLHKRGHEVAVIFPENQPFPMNTPTGSPPIRPIFRGSEAFCSSICWSFCSRYRWCVPLTEVT